MRLWITSCLVLFGMIELYQWIKHFTLPLPMFILGGALLAIASNYDKLANWSLGNSTPDFPSPPNTVDSPSRNTLNQSQTQPLSKQRKSISFTIRGVNKEL
ncbi:MAG TPA: hypothetical protein V6C95_01795 [Coleofasciculaceae cyanobacterium]